jgi:hypothetical protein
MADWKIFKPRSHPNRTFWPRWSSGIASQHPRFAGIEAPQFIVAGPFSYP